MKKTQEIKKIDIAFGVLKHIKKVETNCYVLAKHFASLGQEDFAIDLIKRARKHDLSKFNSFELKNLHMPNNNEDFAAALRNHHIENSHHPEHYNHMIKYKRKEEQENFAAIKYMSLLDIAEMVCDWVARGQEFGTSVREWIENEATKKYKFSMDDEIGLEIQRHLAVLLTPKF